MVSGSLVETAEKATLPRYRRNVTGTDFTPVGFVEKIGARRAPLARAKVKFLVQSLGIGCPWAWT